MVVVEDNLLMRTGIDTLLRTEPGLDVVGAGQGYDELIACVESLEPDVIVTDIRMPPTNSDEGIRAAVSLRASHPSVGVVVLSQFVDPGYLSRLIAEGSNGRGYLLKERIATPGELVGAVRAVAAGGSFIDPLLVDSLVKAGLRGDRSALARLTTRELQTLTAMASGKSNAAIAAGLVVSERAVEKHINSIFTKLDLVDDRESNRRVKAVLMFLGRESIS